MNAGNYDVRDCGWDARYAGNGCHTVAHGHTRGNYIAGMFSGTPGGHNEQSGSFKGERDMADLMSVQSVSALTMGS